MREFPRPSWRRAKDGAAAVEFALVGPLLIALIMGIMSYGGYFWIAHAVQQMANDAARATIAGLTQQERETLANAAVARALSAHGALADDAARVEITRAGAAISVTVVYDARGSVFWTFDKLLPMPSPRVARTATIQMGGF